MPQSFASVTREQLYRMPLGKSCCMTQELAALFKTCGTLSLRGRGRVQCTYRAENVALARRIIKLLKARMQITPSLYFVNHSRLGGQKTCVLTLTEEDSISLLKMLRLISEDAEGTYQLKRTLPRRSLSRNCCRRAFLRGAFLGSGYISNPEKSYHLEMIMQDEALGKLTVKLMEKSSIPAKVVDRRGTFVVYIKESQVITDFLTLIGAHDAVVRMEEIRVMKTVKNNVNRLMNCDQANMEKQLNAAERQTEAIASLVSQIGFDALPDKLREIAVLRLRQPEASLKQLGEMLSPPLSKSGVSHRLRQIERLAHQTNS